MNKLMAYFSFSRPVSYTCRPLLSVLMTTGPKEAEALTLSEAFRSSMAEKLANGCRCRATWLSGLQFWAIA